MKKHQLDIGVSGFKIDEVDGFDVWVWPDNATFPSGHDGEQMRQTYGTQMMELTDQIYRDKNQRSYGLIRAANALRNMTWSSTRMIRIIDWILSRGFEG